MEDFVPIPHFLMPYHHETQVPPHSLTGVQPPMAHQQSIPSNMGIQGNMGQAQGGYDQINRWQPMQNHHSHQPPQHLGSQYIPSAETIQSSMGTMKHPPLSQSQNVINGK